MDGGTIVKTRFIPSGKAHAHLAINPLFRVCDSPTMPHGVHRAIGQQSLSQCVSFACRSNTHPAKKARLNPVIQTGARAPYPWITPPANLPVEFHLVVSPQHRVRRGEWKAGRARPDHPDR